MKVRTLLFAGVALLCCWRLAGAAPLIPPDEILGDDELRPGMKGIAKSVFQGTKVEAFPITVLGVLEKIDFGANLILIRIDGGPPVSSGAGLSAGMSGSPVYVNGRLIGAISLTWPFAKEPIAGVTPIRQMLEAFEPGSAPKAVRTSGTLQPRGKPLVLPEGKFTRAVVGPQAEPGPGTLALRPLATPVFVSGLSSEARRHLERLLEPFGLIPISGPGHMSNPPAAPPIEAGSAVGVQLVTGDIDATAIGTVTWAKGGKVIAFGHPMMEAGAVDLPLTAAYVHGVVPSLNMSMKIASPLAAVGRLTQDRPWCVGGNLGETAHMVPIALKVADLDRKVERTYSVKVVDHRGLTQGLAFSAAISAVASLAPPLQGTTTANLVIRAEGLPEIRRTSAYASGERGSLVETLFGGSPFGFLPLGELMEALDTLENNPFGRARLTGVDVDISVTAQRRSAVIESASSSKHRAKPGDEVEIAVALQPYGLEKTTKTVRITIPQDAFSGRLQVGISGGRSLLAGESRLGIERPQPTSLEQAAEQLSQREPATDLVVDVVPPTSALMVSGFTLPSAPYSLSEVLETIAGPERHTSQDYRRTTVPTPFVVSGNAVLSITVEADEKDKAGPRRMPQAMLPGMEEIGQFFGGLFRMAGLSMPRAITRAKAIQAPPDAATEGEADQGIAEEEEEGPPTPSLEELEELSRMEPEEVKPPEEGAAPPKRAGKSMARPASVWKQASAKDFAAGTTDGTAVRSDGRLVLAPSVRTVFEAPDQVLWALAVADGKPFIGSWPEAKVYRAASDGSESAGKPTLVMDAKAAGITALAAGPEGKLYAAAAPGGAIYQLDPSQAASQASLICHLDATYVWALVSRGHDLYAATGPQAAVYRIDVEKGSAQPIFRAPDRHVIAMAIDAQGQLYAGTYPKGKLYRIAPDGKVEPLYELPDETIQSLAIAPDGAVYVGTSPKGQVWRIVPGGQAKLLLDTEERYILALVPTQGGVLAAAGGRKAKIYRVGDDGTSAVLYQPLSTHALAMAPDGAGGIFATLAGSGRLVHLQFGSKEGTFTSAVRDAGTTADWGRIAWQANSPQGTSLSCQTRTGNTAWPDATWSGWSAEYTDQAGARISSPPARYIQYRCRLKAEGQAAPSLERVQTWYMTRNRPPEVNVTSPASGDVVSGRVRVRWQAKDPDKDTLSYQVFYSRDGAKTWSEIAARVVQPPSTGSAKTTAESPPGAPKKPSARPAEQRLTKKAKQGEKAEETAKEAETAEAAESEEASHPWVDWDTKRVKDGVYLVKVTTSDKQSNPTGALSAEDISHTFAVDNTPPVLTLERTGGAIGKVICRDATSYIVSADYRVDGGPWAPLACEDGVFDDPQETLIPDAARMPAGRHKIEIRARDAAGNEGTASATYFKVQAR